MNIHTHGQTTMHLSTRQTQYSPNITSNFKNKQNTKTKSRFNSLKKRRVLCEIKGWELW